jgi:hypothetical protein
MTANIVLPRVQSQSHAEARISFLAGLPVKPLHRENEKSGLWPRKDVALSTGGRGQSQMKSHKRRYFG